MITILLCVIYSIKYGPKYNANKCIFLTVSNRNLTVAEIKRFLDFRIIFIRRSSLSHG